MARIHFDITVSLDGYVAGPNRTLDEPLGAGVLSTGSGRDCPRSS